MIVIRVAIKPFCIRDVLLRTRVLSAYVFILLFLIVALRKRVQPGGR